MFFGKFATITFVKISAVIITFNEEANIADAIDSVRWADEILVVDSESTDDTVAIAKSLGAKVIVRPWPGFSQQKQFAADAASNELIISLDADERISGELAAEIESIRNSGVMKAGYRIPRLTIYMGRPIRHGGWYPDRQLRLFDRRLARWKSAVVHESVEITNGSNPGELRGNIIHHSVESAAHHHRMVGERYAPLAARQMFERGRRTSPFKTAVSALSTFTRFYVLKLGFLDGFPGLCIAYFAAYNTFLKHLMLWEMQDRGSGND